jgi:DNA-binding MarR family transcriptional regulator
MSSRQALVDAPQAREGRRPRIVAVADNLTGLLRMISKAKAQLLQNAQADVERAAQVLLRSLEQEGPMRASALAQSVGSDPSTISRQIASLVKDGLLERRADQADGRACLLVPTEAGRAVIAQNNQARMDFYDGMLADWTSEDLDQFAALLVRFGVAYEQANEAWMLQQPVKRSARTAGRVQ